MASPSLSFGMANTGQDDLSHNAKVVMKRVDHWALRIFQAFINASIKDIPSLLLLDQQEIENLYHVNKKGMKETLRLGNTNVLKRFCEIVSKP